MFNKIFRSGFITSMVVLVMSFLLIFGVLFEYFETRMFDELQSEAKYIAYTVEKNGISVIDDFDTDNKRITVISADGTVLTDTVKEAKELENHSDRKEIIDAISNGSGKSTRYSNTLTEMTLYYAEQLSDGNILRVSTTQNSIIVILLSILHPVLVIVAIAVILSLILSYRISNSIIKPINAINLDNPTANDTYEELTPLLKKLSVQKDTIDRQIKDAHQKREEFKLITENMSEGLIVIDKNANVLSYNRAAVKLLEVQNVKAVGVLAFNRTKEFRDTVYGALSGERRENCINHGENTYNLTANPVYDNDKIIGAVIVIIDITESVKREQLRREFTSNVSHELKTPLTSISGFAEMLKNGGVSEDTVIDFSTSIYDEAQRLIGLVSDIMKLSELDEKSSSIEKENVNLLELSQEIAERFTPVAKKQNVTINVSGDVAYVYGVKKILDEMIYNLCDNAIKYNKENGNADIIVKTNKSHTTICVKDTGIGIPNAEQGRVFERFYRVDKSHSKIIGGTGLGLAIVKHAAAFHNAEISLKSTEGVGTEITVTFEN